jgi:3'-phosphoadenosine 5'-phosphosulfate sulfotransferase (PAPS reductase)/FAD synthetase
MMNKLFVSFSGGRSSARMAYELKTKYSDKFEMIFGFMNTGEEWEQTLEFVDRCDHEFGLNLVWLEAVINPGKRQGTTHRIVNFQTASRNGEPFEAMIRKYGIPCDPFPHCTRELKARTATSFLRSVGWLDNCVTALGIRIDEPKRIKGYRKDPTKVLPMVDWFPMTKPEINDWWAEQSFDLQLADYQGNCKTCWKKNIVKLVRIAKETPWAFDFFLRMEVEHPRNGPEFRKADGSTRPDRTFFRQRQTAKGILLLAESAQLPPVEDADADAGCSESCEVYG